MLPAHIVMFRDGVSESQFHFVLDHEYGRLRDAFKHFHNIVPNYMPTTTAVIVQKRHSTRFYVPTQCQRMDGVNKGNTSAGTVVDRYIVSNRDHTGAAENKEFFLCAHKGMLGTSRPGHYYVLADTWGLSADELQSCAYSLCLLFARAPMAVSIPAPVFYAHLACYRARRHYAAQKVDADTPPPVPGPTAAPPPAEHELVTVTQSLRDKMHFC